MSDPLPTTMKSEVEDLRCALEMGVEALTRFDFSDPEAAEIFEEIRTNLRAALSAR